MYLDTSALVKLYLNEIDSAAMHDVVDAGGQLATSRLTYLEARSAFARRRREKDYTAAKERELIELLDTTWSGITPIEVTELLVQSASTLVSRHGLRAYDALHLASALQLQADLGRPVTFAAFDSSLNKAAKKEKLLILS